MDLKVGHQAASRNFYWTLNISDLMSVDILHCLSLYVFITYVNHSCRQFGDKVLKVFLLVIFDHLILCFVVEKFTNFKLNI